MVSARHSSHCDTRTGRGEDGAPQTSQTTHPSCLLGVPCASQLLYHHRIQPPFPSLCLSWQTFEFKTRVNKTLGQTDPNSTLHPPTDGGAMTTFSTCSYIDKRDSSDFLSRCLPGAIQSVSTFNRSMGLQSSLFSFFDDSSCHTLFPHDVTNECSLLKAISNFLRFLQNFLTNTAASTTPRHTLHNSDPQTTTLHCTLLFSSNGDFK